VWSCGYFTGKITEQDSQDFSGLTGLKQKDLSGIREFD
jgi:hypothetical protein